LKVFTLGATVVVVVVVVVTTLVKAST